MSMRDNAARYCQDCHYASVPAITCDGTIHATAFRLPPGLPRPLAIVSAYYQLHTGTAPITEIGGLICVFIGKPRGTIVLVGGMNRHGAARWTHDPPIMLNENEEIHVSYGCQTRQLTLLESLHGLGPIESLRRFGLWSWGVKNKTVEVIPAGIMPDIQICWIDRKGNRGETANSG